ncbi:AREL1 [Cordylochernes scorpioides]|uniref:AREL1 n=1 Tax=Cordylochernes scorpioides TaxID=51811 RepID=A0ABY6LC95_9ARAC|nr:AREL1 [Cordylochernes scorpioides]
MFCYICGKFTIPKKRKHIIPKIKECYKEYFGAALGDQDKWWCPHSVCGTCYQGLLQWKSKVILIQKLYNNKGLLHIIGDSALEIYNTFGFEENAQSPTTIKDILDKYDQYFRTFKNTIYRRYIFFTCEQKLNKTFEDFVKDIKSKAENYEFENIKY